MMNPSIYLRESERYESERASRIPPEKVHRKILESEPTFRHTREVLPCGCILIHLIRTLQ